ncbi:leucine-rich repeat domain-containing protein [Paenibacillus polymyxa]|uniref:Leucine-rich repeat (Lrr) protein n=1 Tax=Paenibacillus polymyxa TaxID=1406 RepID=A0A378Y3U4_PAEPO|nr:leucine-rich repeat domain-containing protein [Paenibacillus polymyxa]MBE7900256.1 leucine-rich repeat domain-containing protein [Paenibacillus polymyxa]MBG9764850.1 leucine-rich repeat (lrr) protein [Paenibacillus polymyxa]MCC3260182.1 leucine-rich repeat domain-containing protein [Paenibacillus polymyxa]QPK53379.1 leucine-rich repeat domain-containing protein [Paenibacillus polymyxa]QPK58462.1 leucine-rich repeat domain-containing protein [Paenibacillus polymyxa]
MFRLYSDVRGTAYERLIDYAMERADTFMLGVHNWVTEDDNGVANKDVLFEKLLQQLNPFLLSTHSYEEMRGELSIAYTPGTFYRYQCTPEAGRVLKHAASSLFSWVHPKLPEDLCFQNADGEDWIINIAHERIGRLNMDKEDADELEKLIPGVFIHKSEHHGNIDMFLNDAIRHQPDRVELMRFGLTEIPERIRKLRSLKHLTIFEQDVRTLPSALFELESLESLTIQVADLEELPADIAKLSRLKSLRVSCGCYDRPAPDYKVIPKEELAFRNVPPSIGELHQLEYLDISYSGIRTLPPEIQNLRNLRSLDIVNGLIESAPEFIYTMTWLDRFLIEDKPFHLCNHGDD